MRCSLTRLSTALLALALCAGCSPSPGEQSGKTAKDPATIAAEQREAARVDAMRRVEGLETAIQEARQRVAAAEAPGATPTRADRLALSETRRAIVVANVSLQKARTAIAAQDYDAARQATEGEADRLKAIVSGKAAPPGETPKGRPH